MNKIEPSAAGEAAGSDSSESSSSSDEEDSNSSSSEECSSEGDEGGDSSASCGSKSISDESGESSSSSSSEESAEDSSDSKSHEIGSSSSGSGGGGGKTRVHHVPQPVIVNVYRVKKPAYGKKSYGGSYGNKGYNHKHVPYYVPKRPPVYGADDGTGYGLAKGEKKHTSLESESGEGHKKYFISKGSASRESSYSKQNNYVHEPSPPVYDLKEGAAVGEIVVPGYGGKARTTDAVGYLKIPPAVIKYQVEPKVHYVSTTSRPYTKSYGKKYSKPQRVRYEVQPKVRYLQPTVRPPVYEPVEYAQHQPQYRYEGHQSGEYGHHGGSHEHSGGYDEHHGGHEVAYDQGHSEGYGHHQESHEVVYEKAHHGYGHHGSHEVAYERPHSGEYRHGGHEVTYERPLAGDYGHHRSHEVTYENEHSGGYGGDSSNQASSSGQEEYAHHPEPHYGRPVHVETRYKGDAVDNAEIGSGGSGGGSHQDD